MPMVVFEAWVACDSTPYFLLVARETESAFCRTAPWGCFLRTHFHPGPRRATLFCYIIAKKKGVNVPIKQFDTAPTKS